MQISRQLNLVQTVELEGTGKVYLHSTPISRQVWETYFMVLSKTYSTIFSEGVGILSGPSVARMLLQRIAMQDGIWEGPQGVQQGLVGEMRRLTNVIMPQGGGWNAIPFEMAMERNLLDEDSLAEAEGAIVFFICGSAVLRGPSQRTKLEVYLLGLTRLWDRQTSSLDSTAFAASLLTSTKDAPSTEKKEATSTESQGGAGSSLPY